MKSTSLSSMLHPSWEFQKKCERMSAFKFNGTLARRHRPSNPYCWTRETVDQPPAYMAGQGRPHPATPYPVEISSGPLACMFSTWTIQPAPLHRLLGQELRPIEQRLLGLMGFLRACMDTRRRIGGRPYWGMIPAPLMPRSSRSMLWRLRTVT